MFKIFEHISSSYAAVKNILEYGDEEARVALAKYGDSKILKELVDDDSEKVRLAVVERGDRKIMKTILSNWWYEEPQTLYTMASMWGYGLKKLVRHSSPYVREGVATGLAKISKSNIQSDYEWVLDRVCKDPSPDVRRAAAVTCSYVAPYRLDRFLSDPSPEVRKAVARYGTKEHRKMLTNDPDLYVRMEAHEMLRGFYTT